MIATLLPEITVDKDGYYPMEVNLRNLMPGRVLSFWPSADYINRYAAGEVGVYDAYFLDDENNEVVTKVTGDASKMKVVPYLEKGKTYDTAFIAVNATEEEYSERNPLAYASNAEGLIQSIVLGDGLSGEGKPSFKFYDSLTMMQMALNRGEIDVIVMPDFVGEYMLRNNPDCSLKVFVLLKRQISLALGFLEEKADLCKRFNEALKTLTENGMTSHLARYYIAGPEAQNPQPVSFEKFEGAETVNILVTGDMPPLDYVDAGGMPAGYNTAILAEIGRLLHVNINLVSSEAGARAAALKSGRVDAVLWVEVMPEGEAQFDKPEGVVVTMPYYGWNKVFMIGMKKK